MAYVIQKARGGDVDGTKGGLELETRSLRAKYVSASGALLFRPIMVCIFALAIQQKGFTASRCLLW